MVRQGSTQPLEPFARIHVDEAKRLYDEGAMVIDVREPDEYVQGHVKGAILMPVDSVLARVDELPQGKVLLFICSQGVRSALACEMAAAMGYSNLYNIEEGTSTWIEKRYPSKTGMEP
ncbi:MAG: rhodanese-like domain-containing protein [Chloroflexi bacterium]|nr:rhodanese-like domain-containing protein [Chloroflexota bacterium]